MDFVIGGVSAVCAGFFTNPLEVVKTRMQLQGELKARGKYAVHYKNAFHAMYTIARVDGLLALQSGLIPAIWYQLFMNGCRLGAYQTFENRGWTKDKNGEVSFLRCLVAGGISGSLGATIGSPVYMVKTQLQSAAAKEIAVGHQHQYKSMSQGLLFTFREHGVKGLFRGVSGAIPRVVVGSSTQLATFTKFKKFIERFEIFPPNSMIVPMIASTMSGIVIVFFMTPFDVVSTRLYNQPLDPKTHKGLLYRNVLDCFVKVFRAEGLWGFYKGWGASFFRLVPHTVLSLSVWSFVKKTYIKFSEEREEYE